jgi:hypothetical protein
MHRKALGIFLLLAALGTAVRAESVSGTATFPAGSTTAQAVLNASKDVLARGGYEIQKLDLQKGRLEGSATYYDAASAAQSGTAKSTLSWTLTVRAEEDGRVSVLLDHRAEGGREPEDLQSFVWSLAVGAGVRPSNVLLTLGGETKPLPEWNQRKRPVG